MGIFNRLSKALEANLTALVERAEDPAKVLDAAIEDLRTGKAQVEEALIAARTEQRLAERRRDSALIDARGYEDKALRALQLGEEALARQLLGEKLAADARARSEQQAVDAQAQAVADLDAARRDVEARMRELPARRAALLARQASAEARGAIVGAGQGAKSAVADALAAFERIEEKVVRAEVEAEVRGQLRGPAIDTRALDAHEAERALEALRARALPPPAPRALPARAGGDTRALPAEVEAEPDDPVERQLAALRGRLPR